jgi:prepilin-type N-terminal cleavage/methylation domain-containing protein
MKTHAPLRRGGFTILELIIVILITGVLVGVVINSFSRMAGQLNTRSAHDNFLSLHAQARAFAVERGVEVRLVIDPGADQVRVETTRDGQVEVLNQLNFREEFQVDLIRVTGQGPVNLCFTPRGIANPTCGNAVGTETTIRFEMGNRSRSIRLLPLGQASTI